MSGKVKYLLEGRCADDDMLNANRWKLVYEYSSSNLNTALATMETLKKSNDEGEVIREYRVVKETRKVLRQAK